MEFSTNGSKPHPIGSLKMDEKIRQCREYLNQLSKRKHPIVSRIVSTLDKNGCSVHIECTPCKNPLARATYRIDSEMHPTIKICANKVDKYYDVIESVTHELIHVHDHCVSKFDMNDLNHIACTEIRASLHSECRDYMYNEVDMEKCIREHAILSILQLEEVQTLEKAQSLVQGMMSRCKKHEFYF